MNKLTAVQNHREIICQRNFYFFVCCVAVRIYLWPSKPHNQYKGIRFIITLSILKCVKSIELLCIQMGTEYIKIVFETNRVIKWHPRAIEWNNKNARRAQNSSEFVHNSMLIVYVYTHSMRASNTCNDRCHYV